MIDDAEVPSGQVQVFRGSTLRKTEKFCLRCTLISSFRSSDRLPCSYRGLVERQQGSRDMAERHDRSVEGTWSSQCSRESYGISYLRGRHTAVGTSHNLGNCVRCYSSLSGGTRCPEKGTQENCALSFIGEKSIRCRCMGRATASGVIVKTSGVRGGWC